MGVAHHRKRPTHDRLEKPTAPKWQKLVGPFSQKVPGISGTFSQKVPIYPEQRARANTLLKASEPRARANTLLGTSEPRARVSRCGARYPRGISPCTPVHTSPVVLIPFTQVKSMAADVT